MEDDHHHMMTQEVRKKEKVVIIICMDLLIVEMKKMYKQYQHFKKSGSHPSKPSFGDSKSLRFKPPWKFETIDFFGELLF